MYYLPYEIGIYITTHSQTTIFCIVSRVDKRYLRPSTEQVSKPNMHM